MAVAERIQIFCHLHPDFEGKDTQAFREGLADVHIGQYEAGSEITYDFGGLSDLFEELSWQSSFGVLLEITEHDPEPSLDDGAGWGEDDDYEPHPDDYRGM